MPDLETLVNSGLGENKALNSPATVPPPPPEVGTAEIARLQSEVESANLEATRAREEVKVFLRSYTVSVGKGGNDRKTDKADRGDKRTGRAAAGRKSQAPHRAGPD